MRGKSFLIYLLLIFSIVSYNVNAQDIVPDIKVSSCFNNASLKECLYNISNQSGLQFAYRTSLIDSINNITFHSETKNINALLDSLLHPLGIDFVYKNRQIILKKRSDKIHLRGCIISLTDSMAIPYASLSVKGQNLGTISDFKGVFQWELSERYLNDTIIISSMGYKRKYVITEELVINNFNCLFLEESCIKIDPVVIERSEFRIEKLGNKGKRSVGSLYLDTHGQQTGLYIENENESAGSLISVSFFLADGGNLFAPFRVRIYSVDSIEGIPVNDLLDAVLVAKPNGQEGWFKVDLSGYNISFPEQGLFVALEGIFPNDYAYYAGDEEFVDIKNKNIYTPIEDYLPISISYGQQIGFNRKLSERTWHYSLSHTWFQLPKQQYGLLIRATVRFAKQKRKRGKVK